MLLFHGGTGSNNDLWSFVLSAIKIREICDACQVCARYTLFGRNRIDFPIKIPYALSVCGVDSAGTANSFPKHSTAVHVGNSYDPHFFVLYSAQHHRCGRFIERADFRVVTKDDLFAWSRDSATTGMVQPLPLHCDRCSEDVPATHLRIIKDVYPIARTIVPEVEIKHFNVSDWIMKAQKDL